MPPKSVKTSQIVVVETRKELIIFRSSWTHSSGHGICFLQFPSNCCLLSADFMAASSYSRTLCSLVEENLKDYSNCFWDGSVSNRNHTGRCAVKKVCCDDFIHIITTFTQCRFNTDKTEVNKIRVF